MSGADANRALVAKILLLSAVIFAVLAAVSWAGILAIEPGARRLFALSFGICAAADALIGLLLWTRSSTS